MKYTIIGSTLLLMSAIVDGSSLIAASNKEIGTFPITFTFLLLVGGVFILIPTTSKNWPSN